MFEAKDHILHLADGKLQPDSTYADVQQMVHKALHSDERPNGIVMHFHGGLVSEDRARESARLRLYPLYVQRSQTYPIFFVWESGPWDAPRNNLSEILQEILKEIGQENLFQEFVKKAAEWVLKKQPGEMGIRSAEATLFDEKQLRQDFDAWFNRQRPTPPEAVTTQPVSIKEILASTTNSGGLDEEELAKEILESLNSTPNSDELDEEALAREILKSIEGDFDFQNAVEQVYDGLHPDGQPGPSTRGADTSISKASLLSKEAANKLFPPIPESTIKTADTTSTVNTMGFGPIEWFAIARAVAEIVIRIIGRIAKGRSHGLNGPQGFYVTLVEEVLRSLYVDKIGRIGWWDRMKMDTSDAFREGPEYGGTALLTELKNQLEGLPDQPTITLIGHSAGAIHICHFLKAAATLAPNLYFNVIFEAPAASHALLAATISAHGSRIINFRQFGMTDAREAVDTIVPVVYLSSLLYFVSGLLEGEPDEPLVGMQRYLDEKVYDAASYPNIATCRKFYARFPQSLIWSPSTAGDGLNSDGHHHGDFGDFDQATLASVEYILKKGFRKPDSVSVVTNEVGTVVETASLAD